MAWQRLRANVPALEKQVYLNTGVSGPGTLPALQEELTWVRHLAENGPGRLDIMEAALEHVERVRAEVARFIGAHADEVALTTSCSDGIALVAAGLSWQPGDEVIVSDVEHISGLLPWFDLHRRVGVHVRSVPLRDGILHVDDVAAAMSPRTKLICLSHIAYNTGARLPVQQVAAVARGRGALLLVDGAQGPGQIVVDVKQLGCHFYSFPGHKWMLGPGGTGGLYVEEQSLDLVAPALIGWASVEHDGSSPAEFTFKAGASRYEVAGKHVPSLAGWAVGLACLRTVGLRAIEERITRLVGHVREGLSRVPGLRFVTPADESTWSGLVVFTFDGMTPDNVVQALWDNHRIVCRTIPQFDAVRISVHAYNTVDELDLLVRALMELAK